MSDFEFYSWITPVLGGFWFMLHGTWIDFLYGLSCWGISAAWMWWRIR
ncbi:protein of unknown function [Xenorhabdus poinarii G6]|uniref:Uncharacterized protein n=1 Tax=Xenorhabdus poinarii G6 TaxID=1354304 RepID=A0A068R1A6_9GAMM|nr:protein of unknown function [Xenorhabdus poinarii G6]